MSPFRLPLSCLLIILLPLLSLLVPSASAADVVTATPQLKQFRSPAISPSFIGFSLEHDMAWTWTGLDHVRPSFVTLMGILARGGGTTFRIGGNSADYSLYNPRHLPLPNATSGFAYTWSIDDAQIRALHAGVAAVKGQLVFGLNFRNATNASHAIQHARAIERLIGWGDVALKGLEVGNEPDLYQTNGNRGKYSPAQYYDEFQLYVTQLRDAIPSLPKHYFQGGIYCCEEDWFVGIADFTKRFADEIWGSGVHHYPYAACDPKTTPVLADLLIDAAATKLATSLVNSSRGNLVAEVNALGYNLSLSEGNSVACSGAPGVSNTMASNLWVVDELFNSAQAGLSNWIFHSHDLNASHYPPLIWLHNDTDVPLVQPEWYALLFFASATADSSRIVSTPTVSSNPFIKVWTTLAADGWVRVAVLHKDLNATQNASVSLDLSASLSSFPTAVVARLIAPSPRSTYGLSFVGLTWDGSQDGAPTGEPAIERVEASASGVYSFGVSPISLVLFGIPPSSATAVEELLSFDVRSYASGASPQQQKQQRRHRRGSQAA